MEAIDVELQNRVIDRQVHDTDASACMELDFPLTPDENAEPLKSEEQPNKRGRKKSIVWDYFTVRTVEDGCIRACCNQCNKSFAYITGEKVAGTSHLKRHIALGICPVSQQKTLTNGHLPGSVSCQQTLTNGHSPGSVKVSDGNAADRPRKKRCRATRASARIPFDQNRCNHDIAFMIIMHEYPLSMVEQPGFNDFVKMLQPQFNTMSFETIQGECESIYLREKESLLNFVSGIPSRISLSLDIWSSNHSYGYVFLRGHFIDCNWNSHCRILNVVRIHSPHEDNALNQAIITCLSDWQMEGRVFTVTVDQSLLNGTIAGNLRNFLVAKNPDFLRGQLLLGNCYAQVLRHLVQDALSSTSDVVGKIRESVKYVKTSSACEEKFLELKRQLQVPSSKELSIDVQTKWDTTYHMLAAACELKEIFSCLDASDSDYRLTLTMDDWKKADTLCTYLKFFFDAANILTSPSYPTASVFFPEVSKIQAELTQAAVGQDPFVRELTKPLKAKFDKYWQDCCLVLAMAVAMDPRFKMKLVEFTFSKIYGESAGEYVGIVNDGLHDLFLEYTVEALALPENFGEEGNLAICLTETHEDEHQKEYFLTTNGLSDFDIYISEITDTQMIKSELDHYLEEKLLPRSQDFDVLSWWRLNKLEYPTLSKMASDILCMPVSTVASDAIFNTEIRKIDGYRSSLRPATLEALICTRDWLQCGSLSS